MSDKNRIMKIQEEKTEGRNCSNFTCRFYDDTGMFEQNCSGGDKNGDTILPFCLKYIPEQEINKKENKNE